MYSGEYDACDVTLSVYPHRPSLKICLASVGIEPTTFGASIPKVVGSIPTEARHIFKLGRCGYTFKIIVLMK